MIKKLITLIAACLLFVGCQTVSKTLSSTAVTVDAAMQGWATYVALGQANLEQELSVRNAYGKYQASMRLAKDAYLTSVETGDDAIFDRAARILEANAQSLLALIQMFQTSTAPTVR